MIAQPAMTGRHVKMSMKIRMLVNLEPSQPVRRITMKHSPPRGNWNRMEWRVLQPKVETMRGPKPLTAPLTVYADAIISATSQILTSRIASFSWELLNLVQRTPVCPCLKRSTAANRSSEVRNQADTGEFGMMKQNSPNKKVSDPARR